MKNNINRLIKSNTWLTTTHAIPFPLYKDFFFYFSVFASKVNALSFRLFISTSKHTVYKFVVTLHIGQNNSKFAPFFSILEQKMLKMTITTSVWGAQHQNASRNIQHSINKQYIQPRWLGSLMRPYHSVYGLFPCEFPL